MRLLIGTALLLVSATCTPSTAAEPSADTILVGAVVVTNDASYARAQAVAIRDGKIERVGTRTAVMKMRGKHTRVIELDADTYVLPGLVDAHAHLMGLGAAINNVDLTGTTSYAQVLSRVKEAAAAQPDGWILGRGWDQNDWDVKRFPDGAALETAAPGRKVWLRRIDGHAGLASPAALKAAGVTSQTRSPDGGRILRRKDRTPTGVFVDNAMSIVGAKVPATDSAARAHNLVTALRKAAEVGLTGVHDMGVGAGTLDLYRKMDASNRLTLRVYAALSAGEPTLGAFYEKGPETGDFLSVRAVKFYADGALGSRGAALISDYADEPGHKGLLVTPPDVLGKQIRRAIAAGFQPCVHAIGDHGNRVVLDIYKDAAQVRPRIEHAQIVHPEDLKRFAAQNVIASMQPTHATSDMPWVPARIGTGKRLDGAYAWQTLRKSGAKLSFGSDFPVERPNPLEGLYAAMTRSDRTSGEPSGGWLPSQRLSFDEALEGFTSGAAYAGFTEKSRGRIMKGFDADFTIVKLPEDPARNPKALLSGRVVMTIVGGRTVYAGDGA